MNTGLPGYCNKRIPVPRVFCHSLTKVTEVPGKGMGILQNLQKFRVRVQNSQKFRELWQRRTEPTEVAGRYKNAVPVPRVFVARAYRAYVRTLQNTTFFNYHRNSFLHGAGDTSIALATAVAAVVRTSTHRYTTQSVVTGQAPITLEWEITSQQGNKPKQKRITQLTETKPVAPVD